MSKILIFKSYENNLENIVGWFEDGVVILRHELAKDASFSVFGNIAYEVIEFGLVNEKDNVYFIKKFRIKSWAINPG